MIKIERGDLTNIADGYLKKLQEKRYNKSGKKVRTHYIDNMKRFVLAKPNEFESIITEFTNKFREQGAEEFESYKTYMENQYKEMRGEHGYWLLEKLNIKVCPYCNRQYTFTIENKKISPEFDHFYPKSRYPYLALSFYNLMPACSLCNHTKSEEHIDIHPYFDGFDDDFKFRIRTKGGKEDSLNWALEKDIEVNFTDTNRNIDVFALKELYNEHIDFVEEIIDKAQAYNHNYYNSLIDSFRGLGKKEAEIDRFIWGSYLENAEHENRPLSKLTKDILEQLKIK